MPIPHFESVLQLRQTVLLIVYLPVYYHRNTDRSCSVQQTLGAMYLSEHFPHSDFTRQTAGSFSAEFME